MPDTINTSETIELIDTVQAQDTLSFVLDTIELEPPMMIYWKERNSVGLNLNEVAFINWNAGGNNSISALFHGNFERNFVKKLLSWKNRGSFKYGLNAQEDREVRKTDDEFRLSSSFGYRKDSISNWYYSAKFDFNTQIANGYKYPETDNAISKFMAPGYLFVGVGTQYSSTDESLDVYISPLTQKSTFVLDQRLANEGMFGVQSALYDEEGNLIEEGESVRTEIGFLVTSNFAKEIFTNVRLDNRLSLYSDYLNKFGNVDVDWEVNADLKVNNFIRANVGTQLRYDDDVKYKEDTNGDGDLETSGPRVQFKQLLGVGFIYEF
ncbi:MAG TPA: DUF3078 domain-containing protein [Salegentibacter sp.]|nr:DUF3078 domain-containing protein [Salegentibacter sp.]